MARWPYTTYSTITLVFSMYALLVMLSLLVVALITFFSSQHLKYYPFWPFEVVLPCTYRPISASSLQTFAWSSQYFSMVFLEMVLFILDLATTSLLFLKISSLLVLNNLVH